MDFPLLDLLDEQACYDFLVDALHPDGLRCPGCRSRQRTVHRSHRDPVRDYRCAACGRVYNAWTGTELQGTQRRPGELVLIVRGIAQGTPTAQLARELGRSRQHLLDLRHRLQHRAWVRLPRPPLPDAAAEADEMFQNAGEKRPTAPRPRRPAAPAGQPAARARHLRHRPAAGRGRRRAGVGAAAAGGGGDG
jgi:transposase-like protein